MADDDQAGILDTLLAPLLVPRRAARDLEALGTAARGLPTFERGVLERLDDLGARVRAVAIELNTAMGRVLEDLHRLDTRVAAMQGDVHELSRDLAATKSHVAQLQDRVSEAVEHLPDPNPSGPIARAREVIAGTPESSGKA